MRWDYVSRAGENLIRCEVEEGRRWRRWRQDVGIVGRWLCSISSTTASHSQRVSLTQIPIPPGSSDSSGGVGLPFRAIEDGIVRHYNLLLASCTSPPFMLADNVVDMPWAAVRMTHQNCKKLVAISSSSSTFALLFTRFRPSLGLP